MSKWVIDIHGELEGDYDLIKKYEEQTIEAIPKDQYEARLKADMVAMLTDIQLEIEEVPKYCMTHDGTCVYRKAEEYISDINNIIQQKINELRGNENE